MGKRKGTEVSASEVRVWAAESGNYDGAKFLTPREGEKAARGRLPKEVIEAYQEATGNTVVTGKRSTEPAPVELTVTKQDKRGRNYSRKVTKTRAEVLELAGEAANRRGVLSREILDRAAAALASA